MPGEREGDAARERKSSSDLPGQSVSAAGCTAVSCSLGSNFVSVASNTAAEVPTRSACLCRASEPLLVCRARLAVDSEANSLVKAYMVRTKRLISVSLTATCRLKQIRWSLIYRQAALKLLISEKLHDAGTDVTKAVLPELLSQVCQRHVTPTLRLAPRVDCWMEAA